MLGHGHRPADDFHPHAFAQDLYSTNFGNVFVDDVIIGHSLGGTVTLALLPLLSTPQEQQKKKTEVILVDPGIEFSDVVSDESETRHGGVPGVEACIAADHPTWTRQDAVSERWVYAWLRASFRSRCSR